MNIKFSCVLLVLCFVALFADTVDGGRRKRHRSGSKKDSYKRHGSHHYELRSSRSKGRAGHHFKPRGRAFEIHAKTHGKSFLGDVGVLIGLGVSEAINKLKKDQPVSPDTDAATLGGLSDFVHAYSKAEEEGLKELEHQSTKTADKNENESLEFDGDSKKSAWEDESLEVDHHSKKSKEHHHSKKSRGHHHSKKSRGRHHSKKSKDHHSKKAEGHGHSEESSLDLNEESLEDQEEYYEPIVKMISLSSLS